MKNFIAFFVFLSTNFYLSLQSQDLCGEATANGFIFANDPASCSGYLYCSEGVTYQLKCDDPLFPNFFEDGCYSNDEIACVESVGTTAPENNYTISLCPAAEVFQNQLVMFGDSADATCRNYGLCRVDTGAGGAVSGWPDSFVWSSCPSSLVFDRNFGRCSLPASAPCGAVNAPAPPPGGVCPVCTDNTNATNPVDLDCDTCDSATTPEHDCAGKGLSYVPVPGSCTKYTVCKSGDSLGENECAPGLHFNPDINQCDLPANVDPPCTATALSAEFLSELPRAQPKSRKVNPLIPQLREIIMGRRQ